VRVRQQNQPCLFTGVARDSPRIARGVPDTQASSADTPWLVFRQGPRSSQDPCQLDESVCVQPPQHGRCETPPGQLAYYGLEESR
jgi:hypothetical protein